MSKAPILAAALLLAVLPLNRPAAAQGCVLPARHAGVTAYRSSTLPDANLTLYGDSITYQAWRGLAAVERGLAVDAMWGRATAPTVDALDADVVRHVPRTVVLAIGTNDITNPFQMVLQARRARAMLPASTRLLWVNTYVETTQEWVVVNAQIAAIPGVEIVDWAKANLEARGLSPGSPLLSDGIHLTCDGYRTWANLVHRSLATAGPSVRPGVSAAARGTSATRGRTRS